MSKFADLDVGELVAWIFSTEEELKSGLVQLVDCGVSDRHTTLVLGSSYNHATLSGYLRESGEKNQELLSLRALESFCFDERGFNADTATRHLLRIKEQLHREQSVGLRVVLDMTWMLKDTDGPVRLNQFCARAEQYLRPQGITVLPLFSRRVFSPTELLNLLPLFPRLLLGRGIVHNVYYTPMDERIGGKRHEKLLDYVLLRLKNQTPGCREEVDSLDEEGARFTSNEALKELKLIIDSLGDGLLVTDQDGNLVLFNKTAEELIGYSKSDLPLHVRARKFGNYLPDKVTPYPVEDLPVARALRGESVDQEEIFLRNDKRPEGRWLSTTGRPIRRDDGEVLGGVVVFRDITQTKKTEEESYRLEQRMTQTQKLESLGLLAGGIAHDFNNLLMGVLGNAGLALLESSQNSTVTERIEQIKTAAKRLAELTNQLLAYSGQGSFIEQPIQISQIVDELQQLLKTVVSKRADVRCHFDSEIPIICGDATQIRQLVMNLITNASDALGNTFGRIDLITGTIEADQSYLSRCYLGENLKPGTYVYLEVSDTGCGMDPETMARIFDPFYTTKFKGRGLGLAAALGLVRRHGGAVDVKSKQNVGTTFRVLFPPNKVKTTVRKKSQVRNSGFQGKGKVLVVDDEEVVRVVTREMLERSGFTVLTAINGKEGIELFQQNAPEIVTVLLDMTMPDMSGEEVFHELKRHRKDARVIISSGYSECDTTKLFCEQGLAGYLQKPYVPEALLEKIEQVLEN